MILNHAMISPTTGETSRYNPHSFATLSIHPPSDSRTPARASIPHPIATATKDVPGDLQRKLPKNSRPNVMLTGKLGSLARLAAMARNNWAITKTVANTTALQATQPGCHHNRAAGSRA
jgi:hypothetical protein